MNNLSKIGLIGLFKTLWYNWKLFPLKTAMKLPLLVTSKVVIRESKRGKIHFKDGIKPFMLYFGADRRNMYNLPSLYKIKGNLEISGSGPHVIGVGSVVIVESNATLHLGNNVCIGNNTRIKVLKKIKIGDDNLRSHNITIRDSDGHSIYNQEYELLNPDDSIEIGNKVWIGFGCAILKGSHIPTNSIIGACSLVNKKIEAEKGCIFVGSPLHQVKSNVDWCITKPSEFNL